MSIKHSKYKNTGILFELLTRQVVSDTMNGVKNSKALSIIETHFGKNTEMGKEYILYKSFFNRKQLSEGRAMDFVNLIVSKRSKINFKKLAEEKYNLIKTIKEHYDLKDFLSTRVPSYKIYASIYKLFEANSMEDDYDIIEDLSESKYTIVGYLTGETLHRSQKVESEIVKTLREQEEDMRMLTYKMMLERFNKKYANLNPRQKALLKEYIFNSTNKTHILSFVKNESTSIIETLTSKAKNIKNPVILIKLNEVVNQLGEFSNINQLKNEHFTKLMIGYELELALDAFQDHE